MKIRHIETYRVPPRWLFVAITTDDGYVGWGEAVLEGHSRGAEAAVQELGDRIRGTDPRRVNDTWQMLYRNGCYRGGPLLMSALSGIDMALWDILGKAHAVPVAALLGGRQRDSVRTLTWIGGDSPNDLTADARRAVEHGFRIVKFNASSEIQMIDERTKVEGIVDRIGCLRAEFGSEIDMIIDFHGRVHWPMALTLIRELEQFHPLWIEDPVPAGNPSVVIELARETNVPIAVGERVHSRSEFTDLLESRSVRVLNPDPCHVGGISETIRLAGIAEMYDVAIAPHCPLGPIALAASLQIDAACYNAVVQEQSLGIHYNTTSDLLDYVIGEPFEFDASYLRIPEGPGLGIDVDVEAVKRASDGDSNWVAPVWRHRDGSIAEW